MNLSLHQLRILDVVAEEGGVTRAAARLHLTQPTLSIQLKQLGEAVGEPLFATVGRRLVLTEAGHEVRATARAIAHELESLAERISARRGIEQGRLRLTAVSTAEYFLPRLLGEFQRAHPGIDVSLQVLNRADVVRRLDENADDFYLMTRPPDAPGIHAEPMGRNPLVLAAAPGHPWVNRRRIPVKALAGESLVVREPGSGTRLSTEEWLATRGVRVRTRLELGSNEAVKQAVRGGFGLAIISAHALLLEMEHGLVVPLDVAGFPIPSRWHLVTRAARPLSPVATVFRGFLKQQAMPALTRALDAALMRPARRRDGRRAVRRPPPAAPAASRGSHD